MDLGWKSWSSRLEPKGNRPKRAELVRELIREGMKRLQTRTNSSILVGKKKVHGNFVILLTKKRLRVPRIINPKLEVPFFYFSKLDLLFAILRN